LYNRNGGRDADEEDVMRLDKFLSDMNMGTRTELKRDIRKGAVQVNGEKITDPGFLVNENDEIKIKTDRNECGDNTICFISSIIDEAVGVFAFMFFSVGY